VTDWAQRARKLQKVRARAVVLERVAFGAGETNWWHVSSRDGFEWVVRAARPGSVISVYVDDQIAEVPYFEEGRATALGILEQVGEVCLGLLGADGLTIEMEFIAGLDDLAEFEETLGVKSRVFIGQFPARTDDGVTAVTMTVPDKDGVVRGHPH